MFWASFKFTFNLCPVSRVQRQGFLISSFSAGKMMPISKYNQRKIFPIFCDSNLPCIKNVSEGLRGLRGLEGLRSIFQAFQSSMEKIGNIASFFFFGKTLK